MVNSQLRLYRSCKPIVDAQYDPADDETPTAAIVQALERATGSDLTEISPLYNSIDTEALDRLFAEHPKAVDSEAVLSFQVDTWNVFIRADGHIRVCDATQPTEPAPVFNGHSA